jgi:ABC-type uncharacterized transport system YnjBCD permease subunit
MYVDSSPVTARRFTGTPRLRSARRQATSQTASATAGAGPLESVTAAARRTRLADAIVSQWLLEQLPTDHRHALRKARELPA